MKLISIDTEKCVKCGACAEVCPMGIIEIDENGIPEPKGCAYKLCINCGYCVDICVSAALSHSVRKHSADSAAAMKRYEVLQKQKKKKSESNEK